MKWHRFIYFPMDECTQSISQYIDYKTEVQAHSLVKQGKHESMVNVFVSQNEMVSFPSPARVMISLPLEIFIILEIFHYFLFSLKLWQFHQIYWILDTRKCKTSTYLTYSHSQPGSYRTTMASMWPGGYVIPNISTMNSGKGGGKIGKKRTNDSFTLHTSTNNWVPVKRPINDTCTSKLFQAMCN